MADLLSACKQMFVHSTKAFGRNIGKVKQTVAYKSHEMKELRRRRTMIRELGELAYDLGSNGAVFPTEMSELVRKIVLLDTDMKVLQADRIAAKVADAQLRATEKAARAAEIAAAKTAAAIERSTAPVQVVIHKEKTPASDAPVLEIPSETSNADRGERPTMNL